MRTYQDHLKPGYLAVGAPDQPDRPQIVDFVPRGRFYLEVGECSRLPEAPIDEAKRAASLISESTAEKIWLCMSGGVDSESMAWAFLKAGIPFQAAVQRFNNNLNEYDIRHAVEFCEKHGIRYRLFDLDIERFYEDGLHLEYAEKYRCYSPQLSTHIHLLKQIEGFPVLSWNVIKTNLTPRGKVVLCFPSDLYFSYHRFFDLEGRDGVGFFFLYTPELIYSFFRLPKMQSLIFQEGEVKGRPMDYALKCAIYRDGGFPIVNREDKFTGFEEVKKFFQGKYGGDERTYDQRFRDPLEAMFPPPREELFRISSRYLKVT